ncbi:hypothetical protein BASA81_000998 [Batrachochytrium salamandrivorans]|nr:hypothetical protein BASA81_000998 [Batrachochytrium salamandrivorans]
MKLRLLLFSAAAAQAALVAVDQVFYFELSQCPTNFAVLDAENNGLLFLGDGAVTSTAGFTNNKPLFSPGTDPVHTHIGTNNVKVTFPSLETLNGGLGGSLKRHLRVDLEWDNVRIGQRVPVCSAFGVQSDQCE